MNHSCPLCLEGRTSTSICASCAHDLHEKGVELPDPEATMDEVVRWAEASGVRLGERPG